MPLLNQKNITGTTHIRVKEVVISNNIDTTPTITYDIEKVITIGGKEFVVPMPKQIIDLVPGKQTPLRNPQTGELTGQSINRSMLVTALYSFLWEDFVGGE